MDLHANAVLTVRQRQRVCDLVAAGVTITAAALVVGCSRQTASKWVNRRRRGESLRDRSSRPHRSPRRTPASLERAILRTRAELREGPHVIGWALGSRPRPCTPSFAGTGARASSFALLASRSSATSGSARASSSTSTSRTRAGSSRPGHRVTGDRSRRALRRRLAVPVRGDRRPFAARLRLHLSR